MILTVAILIILIASWFTFCLDFIGDKFWDKKYGFFIFIGACIFPVALIFQIGVWLCQ